MKESVSDYLVHLYGELRRVHKAASTKDIEELSAKVYQASARHEKRVAQLQREIDKITRYNDLIWKQLIKIMDPIWKLEEDLVPLYDELKSIYNELYSISHDSIRSPESIQSVQNRINEFENRYKLQGRFVLDKKIKGGQAVINGLLEECYKMTRKLILEQPEIDQSLFELKEKIDQVLTELDMILSKWESEKAIDSAHLQSLQEILDSLDSQQKDSKFLDECGNAPKGQAYIRHLLETAYDRVNEILLNLESNQEEGDRYEALKDLISKFPGIYKETILMSKSTVEELGKTISELLLHPKETLDTMSVKFLSLTRLGVSMLSRAYLQMEPIPDELLPMSKKLNGIKSSLLQIRNEFNKGITIGKRDSIIKNQIIKAQSDLDEIDRSRINGKFVDENIVTGQYHLASLLNECYCLMYELTHRISD